MLISSPVNNEFKNIKTIDKYNIEIIAKLFFEEADIIERKNGINNGLVRQPGWLSHKSCTFSG